jgi:hypothetical protein
LEVEVELMDLQIFSMHRDAGDVRLFVLAIHHCEQDPLEGLDWIVASRGTVALAVLKNGIVAYGLLHGVGSTAIEACTCLVSGCFTDEYRRGHEHTYMSISISSSAS